MLFRSKDLGLTDSNGSINYKLNFCEPDREKLLTTLNNNHNNISQTARELGLSRQSLYRRMDKYDIPRDSN